VDETNVGNRDPLLARSYKGLPKLRYVYILCCLALTHLIGLFNSLERRLYSLGRISQQCCHHIPIYSRKSPGSIKSVYKIKQDVLWSTDITVFRFLEQAVLFSGVGSIRNLARSDPASLSTGFGSQSYIHAVGGNTPLTFVSTVVVGECYLIDPKSINNKTQKLIEGAGIEGEWDRLVGVIGQVINQDVYKAQIQAGYLQFATMFSSGDSGASTHYFITLSMLIKPQLSHPLPRASVAPVVLIHSLAVPPPSTAYRIPATTQVRLYYLSKMVFNVLIISCSSHL